MLKKIKIFNLFVSSCLLYFLTIVGSFAQTESQLLLTNCSTLGDGYINLPNSDVCLKLGGEVRSRFHTSSGSNITKTDSTFILKPDQALSNRIDARGELTLDVQKLIKKKTVRTRLKFSGDAEHGLQFDEGILQYGNIYGGLAPSFGNLTYGAYALNSNYNLYLADNITPLFGYSRDIFNLFNFGISLEKISSDTPYNTWDMGYRGEFFGDWGRVGFASGNQIHHFENAHVDQEHPAFTSLPAAEQDKANTVRDLGVIAFYVGAGGEFVVPFSQETEIGANGYFINGTLRKLGIPSIELAQRFASGEDAGRPMDEKGNAISREDYAKSSPNTKERFKHTLIIPSKKADEEAYNRDLKVTQGYSINGGITHAFNSRFSLHLNSGFYSIRDYDYRANNLMIGTSMDFKPFAGLRLAVGGEFLKTNVTYVGSNQAINSEFEFDKEGNLAPAFTTTFLIAQSF